MTQANEKVPKKLLKRLKKALKKHLKPAKVVDLYAKGKVGWNGDPFIKIGIVFEKLAVDKGLPDAQKLILCGSIVRPILDEAGDTRYPSFSYHVKGLDL